MYKQSKVGHYAFILSLLLISYSVNAVPSLMNYQGRLTTNSGTPLNGTYSITFVIYDAAIGGDTIWTETQLSVSVTDALFSVLLGSINPIQPSVFSDSLRYLGIKVGSNPELVPRTRITSVAYAMHSAGDGIWSTNGNNVYRSLGNVGIGTNNPIEKFDIHTLDNDLGLKWIVDADVDAGAYALLNSNNGRGRLTLGGTSDAGSLLHTTGGWQWNTQLNIMNGFVGIGTTDPEGMLHIIGNDIIAGGVGEEFIFHTRATAGGDFLQITDRDAGGPWKFGQGIVLDQSGNVGIGTTSPIYKLQVEGNFYGQQHFTQGISIGNGSSYTLNKGDEFRFETTYGYATAPVKIAVRGNFANNALDNQDALFLSFQRQDGSDYDTGLPYFFDIGQFGVTKFRLDKNGNVGIGTTNPTAKLHVVGDMCVTGQKNAIVPTSQGMTKMYSEESAEVWFTDYGKATLENGKKHIELDDLFLETVTISDDEPMIVFLQEEDECNGLIVKTGLTGFDVIEKANGRSDASFSYRIVAKRKGQETARLENAEVASTGGGR